MTDPARGPTTEAPERRRRRHALAFTERVPLHDGAVSRHYVADCRCGWQSPLCQTADRARALYDAHVAARRKKRRV